jgi:hypothetical protein
MFKELVIHTYSESVPRKDDPEINKWRVGAERTEQCMACKVLPTQEHGEWNGS